MQQNVMEQYSSLMEEYRRCWFCGRMVFGTGSHHDVDGESRQFCTSSCHDFYQWYQETLAVLDKSANR